MAVNPMIALTAPGLTVPDADDTFAKAYAAAIAEGKTLGEANGAGWDAILAENGW